MKKLLTNFLTTCLCLFVLGACASGKEDIPDPQPQPEADRVSQNPSTLALEAGKGTATISFQTNRSWNATSSESWCSVSPTNGNAGAATLTITYAANPDEKERTATISIKAGTASATIIVKQAAKEADNITLSTSTYEIATDGASITLNFTTNVSWTASSDQDWCKLSETEGEKGTQNLSVAVDKNINTEDRTATITLNAGKATKTVTVAQYRKEFFELEKTMYEIEFGGGKIVVPIKSNTEFKATPSVSWITISKTDKDKIEIDIPKNPQNTDRKGTVTLNGKYTSISFYIQQACEKIEDSGIENMPNVDWNS